MQKPREATYQCIASEHHAIPLFGQPLHGLLTTRVPWKSLEMGLDLSFPQSIEQLFPHSAVNSQPLCVVSCARFVSLLPPCHRCQPALEHWMIGSRLRFYIQKPFLSTSLLPPSDQVLPYRPVRLLSSPFSSSASFFLRRLAVLFSCGSLSIVSLICDTR